MAAPDDSSGLRFAGNRCLSRWCSAGGSAADREGSPPPHPRADARPLPQRERRQRGARVTSIRHASQLRHPLPGGRGARITSIRHDLSSVTSPSGGEVAESARRVRGRRSSSIADSPTDPLRAAPPASVSPANRRSSEILTADREGSPPPHPRADARPLPQRERRQRGARSPHRHDGHMIRTVRPVISSPVAYVSGMVPFSVLDLAPIVEGGDAAPGAAQHRSTSPGTPSAGATGASGSPSTTTCPASPAPPPPS